MKKKESFSIRSLTAVLVVMSMVLLTGCQGAAAPAGQEAAAGSAVVSETSAETAFETSSSPDAAAIEAASETSSSTSGAEGTAAETGAAPSAAEDAGSSEKKGELVVLFTSDVHCGVDEGFGYAGLMQIRTMLEKEGYTTILVDNGDFAQGGTVGTFTKGESVIRIMNAVGYDVVIPGNHDFDYGVDQFMHLTELADFPFISCNFIKDGKLAFPPYLIKEACGIKVGFVGVCTPETIILSTPSYFENDKGEMICDFMQDKTGEKVYNAVQSAVDSARADGADYVYVMGHLGNQAIASPWTYADVISHTNGIDAFLDGHSHDTDQVTMKNKDGKEVKRVAVGTKLNCIGYSHVTKEDGIKDVDAWSWMNKDSAPDLFDIDNDVSRGVNEAMAQVNKELDVVVAKTEVELTINDPVETDSKGMPIRMVRRAETNLGDFCADALRIQLGTDIGIINGGGIRTSIDKGDITKGEILDVFPFGNTVCILEVTGQQMLDALEWGARSVPNENGGFLQVSGMSYEVDVSVPDCCIVGDDGMCQGFNGKRRVCNVKVGDEPIEPKKTYTLGSLSYTLLDNGDGFTAFNDSKLLDENGKLDNQVLMDYITDTLGGDVGGEYADPAGQGRITIVGE